MRNHFTKPATLAQWLLGSVCWTVPCIGGWLLVAQSLAKWHLHSVWADTTIVGTFWAAHLLIWRRGLSGGDSFLRRPRAAWSAVGVLGSVWFAALLVLQMVLLLQGLLGTLFTVLFFCHNCID